MHKKLLLLFVISFHFVSFSQQAYYNNVDLNLTGVSLKNALATKIIASHTNMLSYTPGVWEASKITDANANNTSQVVLIYGWENGSDSDATNDLYRDNNLQDTGNGQSFVWNREHVFSKSLANPKLTTDDPGPGTDAHNLRPADRTRNSLRSNKKFTAGTGTSHEVSGKWYPGDQWKGDVARIVMYMYLRYGNQCLPTAVGNGSNSATPDDMIDLFLQWNAEDPVSDLEKKRNTYHENTNNTYAQGNRNPFIDNPRLATRIWGGPQAEDIWGIYTSSDTEAPTTPTNITLSNISTSSIDVSWSASTDNTSVTSYDVFVDGNLTKNVTSTATTISGLNHNTTYAFTILAKDAAENKSSQSAPINGTTLTDTEAPTIPSNVVVSNQTGTSFKITWAASTDNTATTGYNIYLDGSKIGNSTSLEYTATGLTLSTTYSVQISAFDAANNESTLSTAIDGITTDGTTTTANELFFSEYVEGSSNNKALEIANVTSNSIDLSSYSIRRNSGGGNSWSSPPLNLSGSIAAGDVYVIINGSATNQTLINQADYVHPNTSATNNGAPINFNGDDPVGLFKNGVLIDIIGVFNGMQGNFAIDKTLRRKRTISQPNTTFNLDNEWDVLPKDTVNGIGNHDTNTASIEDDFIRNFKIYPNPIKEKLSITSINSQIIKRLTIYSIQGKKIISSKLVNNSLNLSSLDSGIYILKLEAEKRIFTTKIIKN